MAVPGAEVLEPLAAAQVPIVADPVVPKDTVIVAADTTPAPTQVGSGLLVPPETPKLLANFSVTGTSGGVNTVTNVTNVSAYVFSNWYLDVKTTFANHAWDAWTQDDRNYIGTAYSATTNTVAIQAATQNVWLGWTAPIKGSQEERRLRKARKGEQAKAYLLEQKKREEELVKANSRAEKLLVRELSPEQRETLLTKKYFDVDVGDKKYRVHHGTNGNVKELDSEGREVASFCVQPDNVPVADAMLAQVLFLRYNPKEFFAKANKTELRPQQNVRNW